MPLSLLHRLVTRRSTADRTGTARSRLKLMPLEDRVALSTFVVDDDFAGDNAAARQYTTISAAIAAASAEDTIRVNAGMYDEVVTVNKSLTLIGSGPDALRRNGNPNQEAVVQAVSENPLGIVNLRADGIVFQGFTVQGNTAGPGMFTDPNHSGYVIAGNLVRRNNPVGTPVPNLPSGGLHLNSSGAAKTLVQGNAFKDHTAESYGDGVYTELFLRNAEITDNYFEGNVHYSVDLAGSEEPSEYEGFAGPYDRSSDILIQNNTIVRSGGVQVQYADRVQVLDNTISHATRTGVIVGGRVNDVTISDNTFKNAANVFSEGVHYGLHTAIFVGTLDVAGPIVGVVISGNTIEGHLNGIWLAGSAETGAVSGVTVTDNTIERCRQDGILLQDADGNTIQGNRVAHNHLDGIHVDAASTGNTLTGNRSKHNGGFDVFDASIGAGTDGTGNIWFENEFGTTNRPGLG